MCSLGIGSSGRRLYSSSFWKMLEYLTQVWGHWGLPLCCCLAPHEPTLSIPCTHSPANPPQP